MSENAAQAQPFEPHAAAISLAPASEDRHHPILETLQAASLRSGIPYNSLRTLVRNGQLRRIALGADNRRIWIRRGDLDDLLR